MHLNLLCVLRVSLCPLRSRRDLTQRTLRYAEDAEKIFVNFGLFVAEIGFYDTDRVIRSTTATEGQLHQRAVRVEVVAVDQGPQAYRSPLPGFDHVLLLHRRSVRADDSPRAADAAGRFPSVDHVQQSLYPARHHNDLFLPDTVDSGHAGKLSDPDDDRREGSRFSTHQSVELVHLHAGWRDHDLRAARGRCRYRLDVLHTFQHDLLKLVRRRNRPRNLHQRLLFNPDRIEFHRHDSHDASAGDDMVSPAVVYLVTLRHQHD